MDKATAALKAPPVTAPTFSVPMTVYDALGNDYKLNIVFTKNSATGLGSTWDWDVSGAGTTSSVTTGKIDFGTNGTIDTTTNPDKVKIILTPDDGAGNNTSGTAAFPVDLDFSKITSFSNDCSVKPKAVDGYTAGSLVTFNVGADGILTGVYDNGQQQALGQVAITGFENPAGLQKVGNNMYIPTTNSGDFKAEKPGSNGIGTLSPGTLEMSNVDLSKEFTDMIITQRGFQANSRIITTSDEMLQELVNLKR